MIKNPLIVTEDDCVSRRNRDIGFVPSVPRDAEEPTTPKLGKKGNLGPGRPAISRREGLITTKSKRLEHLALSRSAEAETPIEALTSSAIDLFCGRVVDALCDAGDDLPKLNSIFAVLAAVMQSAYAAKGVILQRQPVLEGQMTLVPDINFGDLALMLGKTALLQTAEAGSNESKLYDLLAHLESTGNIVASLARAVEMRIQEVQNGTSGGV